MGAPLPKVAEPEVLRAQPGPQTMFLASDADVAIYGGSAFAGKTFALMLDDARGIHLSEFASVTFRRDTTQIRNPGGLWDESCNLFASFGARPLSAQLAHVFRSGAVVKFAHLEYAKDVYAWDGSQLPVVKFDQLESFEASQFWYMLSRNRDPSGKIKPYCRATCNPRPGWLADLLAWWIDQDTGYAIWERSGVLRWMHREGETLHWGDSREEVFERFKIASLPDDHPVQPRPLSITFIPGRIWDNKIGLQRDPSYLSKLKMQQRVERERLLGDPELGGNWKVSPGAGNQFSRHWCQTLEVEPQDVEWVRGWDLAATKPSEASPDPDWTVGVRLGKYRGKRRFVIASNVVRLRAGPAGVETAMKNTADADGPAVSIRIPQDPGQAGKAQGQALAGMLAGYPVSVNVVTGDKVTRFAPFSAQAEVGNVDLVKGLPESYLASLENFPDGEHDDDTDATAEAFAKFAHAIGGANLIEFYRRQVEAARLAAEGKPAAPEQLATPEAAKANGGNGSTPHPGPESSTSTAPSLPSAPIQPSSSFFEAAQLQGRTGDPEPKPPMRPPVITKGPNGEIVTYVQGSYR